LTSNVIGRPAVSALRSALELGSWTTLRVNEPPMQGWVAIMAAKKINGIRRMERIGTPLVKKIGLGAGLAGAGIGSPVESDDHSHIRIGY